MHWWHTEYVPSHCTHTPPYSSAENAYFPLSHAPHTAPSAIVLHTALHHYYYYYYYYYDRIFFTKDTCV